MNGNGRSYELFDNIELDFREPRGVGELRRSWTLLKVGDNQLKKDGKDFVLRLSAEDIASAVRHHKEQGVQIPLDSRHALYLAAEKAGVDESEALRMFPQRVAALGFANLSENPVTGNLDLVDVEWLPLAREMYKNGQLRYYSPVVRGLNGESPFRVTSVAIDNVPALSKLDVLAASGEEPGQVVVVNKGEVKMKELEKALRVLFGDDSLALGAEGEKALAEKVSALAAELPDLREAAEQVVSLKAKLEALSASKTETEQEAAALSAENARLTSIEEELGALKLAAETGKKTGMIEAALAQGKICKAQKDVLMKMDSVALAEFLEASPEKAVVPTGAGATKAVDLDTVFLSAEEIKIAKSMGLSQDDMLAEKKRQLKAKEG